MPLDRTSTRAPRRPASRPTRPTSRLAVRGAGSSLGVRPPRWATVVLATACALTLGLAG